MELGRIRVSEEEQLKIEQQQTVNVTFPSSNIFLHGKKAHLAVWRRNEQTPLTNQHGQSPRPCMAEEKRGNYRKVFFSFNKILLIIAIPNPNFIQNELGELIVQFSSLFWHQLVATISGSEYSNEASSIQGVLLNYTKARGQTALILDSLKVWPASTGSSTGSSQAESVDIDHFGLQG